jgi:hypothetical protein
MSERIPAIASRPGPARVTDDAALEIVATIGAAAVVGLEHDPSPGREDLIISLNAEVLCPHGPAVEPDHERIFVRPDTPADR